MINILISPDNKYTMPCGITICSICENNIEEEITFYVLTDQHFTKQNFTNLQQLVSKYKYKHIVHTIIDTQKVNSLVDLSSTYYPVQAAFRLFCAELLPKDVEKIIYFDCDIIVRHSLAEMWAIDISEYSVGCVPDGLSGNMEFYNRLSYPYEEGYFNSGSMIINLKYWRDHDVSRKFVEFFTMNPQKIFLFDQDTLNYVLRYSKKTIDFKFNLQASFLYNLRKKRYDYTTFKDKLLPAIKDPVVLHFSGIRPWIKYSYHPYINSYYYYKGLTQWKDEPLWNPHFIKQFGLLYYIKEIFRDKLSEFGLCNPRCVIYDPDIVEYGKNFI